MKSPYLLELLREAYPGTCPLCGEKLKPNTSRSRTRPYPKWCKSADCKRLHHNLYVVDRRAAEAA